MTFPWLYDKLVSVTSQHGEDGILAAIFDKIGIENKWCVDIGASDGYFISNTWNLVYQNKWSAVMVEAGSPFDALKQRYSDRSDVYCLKEFVSPQNDLDSILPRTPVPKNFDLMSLDIDGMDYKLWEKLSLYRPRVVVVEVNSSMDKDIDLVQENPDATIGTSLRAMTRLAKSKGYELAVHVASNAIFVDQSEFSKLGIDDNSIENLFFSPFVPKVVSDLNGVHYVLKEGPWGFSGAIYANDMRPQEWGNDSAMRMAILSKNSKGSELALHASGTYGFKATASQDPAFLKMLLFYIANNRKAEEQKNEPQN